MDAAIVAARLVQFTGAMVLFGTPLFFLYGLRGGVTGAGWAKPLLSLSAGAVLVGSVIGLVLQTASMAGDPTAAFDRETLMAVITGSAFGAGVLARFVAAAVALVALFATRAGSRLWLVTTALATVVLASFAWTGHGAAEDGMAGRIHAAADVLHLLAAGIWLGALAALAGLLNARRRYLRDVEALHRALAGFSSVGTAAVAVIVTTGLVNSWFLVGPSRILQIGASTYGLLLLVKLGAFVAMLGLAATNRFFLTPDLESGLAAGAPDQALAALRRSVMIETVIGLLVLTLVSVLGTLPPVSAQ